MKLAVWNLEWLNDMVTTDDQGRPVLKPGDARVRGPKPPWQTENPTVAERSALIAEGLADLDADAIVVVEGPNLTAELQAIFDALAPGEWLCHVQRSRYQSRPGADGRRLGSAQCVGIALRTDRGLFADPPAIFWDSEDAASGSIHAASEPFFLDIEEDGVFEWFRYERRPLYVEIRPANGRPFRVLGLHLKSKGIFQAYEWSKWWQLADANRRRLLAQCRHIRTHFLDPYLTEAETSGIPLVVCGDINDGPGFDTSEMRLLASGVETLMGSVWKPVLTLGNALYDSLPVKDRDGLDFSDLSTTRFPDPIFNDTHHRVWIDHILYSRNAPAGWVTGAAIPRETAAGTEYWKISDHFPVIARINLPAPIA
ncbi:hypothetical protein J7376_00300 [Paracoccus sp. R12_1]|uniref:endonuclease/exonuclease/phosphatase family protein n=1 Tax=unclassified Paracoccus (in: a-proteobacteria) TaxID=2688777 RepID=UPI001ADBC70D|nr:MULTISPECIES: hypothetical protein [unclassified Paracoccus (in: a-proteobacteria)]MBO9454161.1 hypothetical protein [Paracoccus sp. R12_2]MBO9484947.1 hypothetical protein [Paracoccus sp. R12_1]